MQSPKQFFKNGPFNGEYLFSVWYEINACYSGVFYDLKYCVSTEHKIQSNLNYISLNASAHLFIHTQKHTSIITYRASIRIFKT